MNGEVLKLERKNVNGLEIAEVLLNGVPMFGGMLASGVGLVNCKLANDRLICLLEKLNKMQIKIDDAMKQSPDFIHGITIVMNAVARTHREEKINMFAHMIKSGVNNNIIINEIDIFEYYVNILESLNYKELEILECLYKYNNAMRLDNTKKEENSGIRGIELVFQKMSKEVKIEVKQLKNMLERLSGMGMCEKVTYTRGLAFGASETEKYYKLNKNYIELRKLILKEAVKKCDKI